MKVLTYPQFKELICLDAGIERLWDHLVIVENLLKLGAKVNPNDRGVEQSVRCRKLWYVQNPKI